MKHLEFKGQLRESIGKKFAKKYRSEGQIPCVIYGGEKNIHFTISNKDANLFLYTPASYLLKINIEGTIYDAILKDSQFHPVTDETLHLDFYQISDDKPITIKVPIRTEGFAKGVKAGGKLQILSRKLRVRALAKYLPDFLTVNVEEVELGKSIKVKELNYENLELIDAGNNVVVAVKLTRAAKGNVDEESKETTEEKTNAPE